MGLAGGNQFESARNPFIHFVTPQQVKRAWEYALQGSTETHSSRKYHVSSMRWEPSVLSEFSAKQGCPATFVPNEGRSAPSPILINIIGRLDSRVSVRVLAKCAYRQI
jgi:hypothetical protein